MSSNKPFKAMYEKGLKAEVALDTDGTAGLLMMRGTGADEITPTTAQDDACVGVAPDQADADDYTLLQKFGICQLYADGAISQDEEIIPSANHNGHATASSNGVTNDVIVGHALEAAADGDSFTAILYIKTDLVA